MVKQSEAKILRTKRFSDRAEALLAGELTPPSGRIHIAHGKLRVLVRNVEREGDPRHPAKLRHRGGPVRASVAVRCAGRLSGHSHLREALLRREIQMQERRPGFRLRFLAGAVEVSQTDTTRFSWAVIVGVSLLGCYLAWLTFPLALQLRQVGTTSGRALHDVAKTIGHVAFTAEQTASVSTSVWVSWLHRLHRMATRWYPVV